MSSCASARAARRSISGSTTPCSIDSNAPPACSASDFRSSPRISSRCSAFPACWCRTSSIRRACSRRRWRCSIARSPTSPPRVRARANGSRCFCVSGSMRSRAWSSKCARACPRSALRARLQARLAEIAQPADPGRLEQELVLQLSRMDVDEELDRLAAHVAEARRVLALADAVGRRLDFLMQEFNREANTLASKSVDQHTTQAAVELKVLIEQMREQVQNIE